MSYCDRWVDRPALEVSSLGDVVVNPPRQWKDHWEIKDDEIRTTADRLHEAIATLPNEHLRALRAWAWANHYNRGLIRKVERTLTGTVHRVFRPAGVTNEQVAAAKVALAKVLWRFNVVI